AFVALDRGDFATAAAALNERDWRARRAAIAALRAREPSEAAVEVTQRARTASATTLITTIGSLDRDAVLCRMAAFAIREHAFFARDPVPRLGQRTVAAPTSRITDRIIVPGAKVARVTEYVSLLRDLAALSPREALAQFDLDDAGYLEVAKAWAAALDADPALAAEIAAGLAKR
ncbi:MAG: hypothetical protein H0V17_13885, partial [Deltaproteobacteria bacterium]|nr:hypothetical protein [Deltaproteobacteria bacterium]